MKHWTRSRRPVDMGHSTTGLERVPLLDVDGLQVHLVTDRGIVKAVDGVSFNVHEHERVALVGESGAGKSVTARSILKLIPDSSIVHLSGSVTYRGTPISDMATQSLKELRGREIGMIFQDPMTYLNPTKRVSQHLAEAVRRSTGRTAIAGDAEACLTAVGLDARWVSRRYPHELSGGMRQRVLIAMVLCCGPRIIIADEPTTALDVTIQAQILRTLFNLTNEYGMALLLITHDLGVVAELCDRIYVMYAGQIVEMTDIGSFFSNPKHPYSRGLLNSLPRIDGKKGEIGYIPGTGPDLTQNAPGCRFRDRCDSRLSNCDREPPVADVSGTAVRCWLYDDSVDRGADKASTR